MVRSPRSWLVSALVVSVASSMLLVPGVAAARPGGPESTAAAAKPGSTSVRVAAINLKEGSLLRHRADLRSGTDVGTFARRLLARPGAAPDVILAQEVLGTAPRAAAALNSILRSRGSAARYAVVTGTGHRFVTGSCDGVRQGRFSLLRSSAVLVNTRTVSAVQARGSVRTWGRWSQATRRIVGRDSYGCTEHPWVRVQVATAGGPRTVTAVNVHVAPRDPRLKTRAVATLRAGVQALTRAAPTDVTVLGGDFNIPRCGRGDGVERSGCFVRPAHRGLVQAGFRDAVRHRTPSGPAGVTGVARRIDFLYVRGAVTDAWWDRCYQAYRVKRWRCARPVFGSPGTFVACQDRAQRYVRPGGRCPARRFGGYYSDHPVVTASVG